MPPTPCCRSWRKAPAWQSRTPRYLPICSANIWTIRPMRCAPMRAQGVCALRVPNRPRAAKPASMAAADRKPSSAISACACWAEKSCARATTGSIVGNRQNASKARAKTMLFPSTIAGSLPKPSWLAEPDKLWPQWRLQGADLEAGKLDATLLAIKLQEDAGIDIVGDGEQSRQHFVHGFLEFVDGIDFAHKVEMGIGGNRYKAMVPVVNGEFKLKSRVHQLEAKQARAHTKCQLKITLPGPMTISDTVADAHYGDKVKMAMAFAGLLNQEARALEADGVDVIQFDEPAFNAFMGEVAIWGIEALERAIDGLKCTTAVHICYGYGIKANIDWKNSLGGEWKQYEEIFPALAESRIDQVSVECINSRVPLKLLSLLDDKNVLVGVIDVANYEIETPDRVAQVIGEAMKYVAKERIVASTNCGMAPMHRKIAAAKLAALGAGAALARKKFG